MRKHINRLGVRTVSAVAAMVFAANAAWALAPFKVQDIRVEGLQRVEPGTIFASLPLRVGDEYNDEKGAAAIRALFALGLFKDVRLEASGNVLVVVVEERPTIADVEFAGTKEFDKDTLKKAMRDVGLTEGRPFDKALADRAEQELKRQYINRSLYGAEVVTTVTPIERNRVNLTFTVTEGEPAKIKEIRIVGNQAFGESTLKGLFDQDTGGWMSWYTKSNRYSRAKLNARPGDAALVLPGARLPGVPHRLHTGGDLAGQAGHLHHHQRDRGPALRGLRREAGGQLPRPRRRVQVARHHPPRRAL
ncbi:outer membrane protein assembly complex, YaeT protein [Alicycliphilus sp. B1]|nr:outer membrane protein assembly complex, YaeT protein [Alicycliphilus sp. B1]